MVLVTNLAIALGVGAQMPIPDAQCSCGCVARILSDHQLRLPLLAAVGIGRNARRGTGPANPWRCFRSPITDHTGRATQSDLRFYSSTFSLVAMMAWIAACRCSLNWGSFLAHPTHGLLAPHREGMRRYLRNRRPRRYRSFLRSAAIRSNSAWSHRAVEV